MLVLSDSMTATMIPSAAMMPGTQASSVPYTNNGTNKNTSTDTTRPRTKNGSVADVASRCALQLNYSMPFIPSSVASSGTKVALEGGHMNRLQYQQNQRQNQHQLQFRFDHGLDRLQDTTFASPTPSMQETYPTYHAGNNSTYSTQTPLRPSPLISMHTGGDVMGQVQAQGGGHIGPTPINPEGVVVVQHLSVKDRIGRLDEETMLTLKSIFSLEPRALEEGLSPSLPVPPVFSDATDVITTTTSTTGLTTSPNSMHSTMEAAGFPGTSVSTKTNLLQGTVTTPSFLDKEAVVVGTKGGLAKPSSSNAKSDGHVSTDDERTTQQQQKLYNDDSSRYDNSSCDEECATSTATKPSYLLPKRRRSRALNSEQWFQRFQDLVQYQKTHGTCMVPSTAKGKDAVLAQWVKRQRYQYKLLQGKKHSHLTPSRVKALEEIGFVWRLHEAKWEDRYEDLKAFQQKYGHCDVHKVYPSNHRLVVWAKTQKRQHRRQIMTLHLATEQQQKQRQKTNNGGSGGHHHDDGGLVLGNMEKYNMLVKKSKTEQQERISKLINIGLLSIDDSGL